jgi:hypothetical protein
MAMSYGYHLAYTAEAKISELKNRPSASFCRCS